MAACNRGPSRWGVEHARQRLRITNVCGAIATSTPAPMPMSAQTMPPCNAAAPHRSVAGFLRRKRSR